MYIYIYRDIDIDIGVYIYISKHVIHIHHVQAIYGGVHQ